MGRYVLGEEAVVCAHGTTQADVTPQKHRVSLRSTVFHWVRGTLRVPSEHKTGWGGEELLHKKNAPTWNRQAN